MRRYVWGSLIAVLVVFAGYCAWLAQGPDRDLSMSREVPSALSLQEIGQSVHWLKRWPAWQFDVKKAERLDFRAEPVPVTQNYLESGAMVRLSIKPGGHLRKPFQLIFLVTAYEPGKHVHLKLVGDSTGRIPRFLSDVAWDLSFELDGSGSRIRGIVTAHTLTARARILAGLLPRVVLNQVFYPDLIQLARLGADPLDQAPPQMRE